MAPQALERAGKKKKKMRRRVAIEDRIKEIEENILKNPFVNRGTKERWEFYNKGLVWVLRGSQVAFGIEASKKYDTLVDVAKDEVESYKFKNTLDPDLH